MKKKNQNWLLLFVYLGLLLNFSCTDNKLDSRPNIIFILTDDQRFDALGYAGNDLIYTPEMDALAKMGAYFKNAMVTTPICSASRASILTGLHERTHNFTFKSSNIRAEYMQNSYPRILKEAGYRTGFFGKYGVKYDSLDKQFDIYESYDRNGKFHDRRGYFYKTIGSDTVHLTRYTGQMAIDFIENTNSKKPFLLSLSFSAPHAHDPASDQYYWQNEVNSLLDNQIMPPPKLADSTFFQQQPEFVKNGFNRLRWGWRYDTKAKYQHSIKGYYRMISGIDAEIGKIRAKLSQKGLDDNTVIILMGDNGHFLGERQLAGKWLLYDNSVRVPLIIFDPRAKTHVESEEMALNIDVPSTILELAGLARPNSWQGKSLKSIVDNKNRSLKRDTILIEHIWEFEHIPPSEGVRTKNWKYFRYVNDKSFEELYNIEEDPRESINLAKNEKYNTTLAAFRQKCDELILKNSDKYSAGPDALLITLNEIPGNEKQVLPGYSWQVSKHVKKQNGYQILVASSEENIHRNIGDIWNSGHVADSFKNEIAHMGSNLEVGAEYYWKVRFYDEDNRLSAYSEAQHFEYLIE